MKKWNAPDIEMANVNETACWGTTTIETQEEENSVSGATVITEPLEEQHQGSYNYGCQYSHKPSHKPSHKYPWFWFFW